MGLSDLSDLPAGTCADVITDLAATGSHFLKCAGLRPLHSPPSQFKSRDAATAVWELPVLRQDFTDPPAEDTPGWVSL